MATVTATVTEKPEVSVENVELRRLGSKDLDRIRLTDQHFPDTLAHHADLFLIANPLGVAAWITPSLDTLQFAPTASLRQAYAAESHDQALAILSKATRSVKLPLSDIAHLALASTGDILIAAENTVVALDAAALASGSATELFRATLPSASGNPKITHLCPNPNPTSDSSLHLLLALTDAGTLHILDLSANGKLVRSFTGQPITAAAWSPKGKQFVYATADRALTRVDPLSGSVAGAHAPCPPLDGYDPFESETCRVVGLVWTDPLAIAVLSVNSDEERMFCTAVLNWKSNAYVMSEPTPPFPANTSLKSPHTYIRSVPRYPGAPNLTLVASTSSLETHTLFTASDPDTNTTEFCAVLLNENTRAVLPNDDDVEHVPLGMALDFTSTETLPPLTPDDPRRVPAMPIVWIMTDIGELVGWHVYELDSAKQRKAYEGMVDPLVKSVEDLQQLAGQAQKTRPTVTTTPPPPPPVPSGKPIKVATTSTPPPPAPVASPFAFTSSSKAPEPGKPLFGAATATTKPFSAFTGAGASAGFGAFGSPATAAKEDDKPKPFSFGSGVPSLSAASKPAETKPIAFAGGFGSAPATSAEAKPVSKPFAFGAASPGAANLFTPKQAVQQSPPPPIKPAADTGRGFGFTPPSVSPPKIESGTNRKAEEQHVQSSEEDEDQQDQQEEEGHYGYGSASESESESEQSEEVQSEEEKVRPPAPAVPATRPRLVQRFKIQAEDADETSTAPAPTTPARPTTSSSTRATPRTLQIPTFTPSKSTSASGLASVTTICTNMAGTLDLLRAKRREIALRIKDHVQVMDAWEDRAADVQEASVEVQKWQAQVDSALCRALIVKDAVDRTRAKVDQIQELIKQINNPEAAGGIGEELGPEQVEGRQRILAGLDKVRTRLRQLEAFAAQQAAQDKERRRTKAFDTEEVQEARISLHSLHLAFKRMHEAIEARAEGVESLVLTMQMMNLLDGQHKGKAAGMVDGESTILEPPAVMRTSIKSVETKSSPKPKVPGYRTLLDKYRRPIDTAAASPTKCIEPTLPVGVGWRCAQCRVRNARLAPQCAKCTAPRMIERAPVPERELEKPVVVPSPQKPMAFTVSSPATPAGLHVRKEPRQPVVQTIESPAAPVPGLDDVEPADNDPTPTKKRVKRGKPSSDPVAQDTPTKSGGRSRTSSSGKPIGNKPKSLSQSSLVPSGGFSMSFAEPSKPDMSPPPPPASAAVPSGGFKLAFAKPAGWVCQSCLVNNPVDATQCMSCETAKPEAKSTPAAPPAPTAPAVPSSGFKLPFAKPTGWTCDSCLVPNKQDATKCASCESPKPGAKPAAAAAPSTFLPPAPPAAGFKLPFTKPTGWTCDSCLVSNKEDVTKCVSCETAKPGTKPAAAAFQPPAPATASAASGGFKLPFAKPAGWTCDSCLVPNKDDATKCASCESPKPGAKPAAAPPSFVQPSASAASSSSGDAKSPPTLPSSGTGFTFGGKPAAGIGFGAFTFGKPTASKDADSDAPAIPAFGGFPKTDAGIPGNPTAAPIVPFGFKPPTSKAKSPSPEAKQEVKHSRTPSPAPKPASPPKAGTLPPTGTRDPSPSANRSESSTSVQKARAASPPRTPTPNTSVTASTEPSTSESARDEGGFEQIAGFETMGESLVLGSSLVLLDNENVPESAGMDEDMADDVNGNGGGAGDDAMDEAVDNSNDAFSGFSLGQPSTSAAVNSIFGGFGGQMQQAQQQQQQREQGASAFGWKPKGVFASAAGSKPSAFGPVSGTGGAFSGSISGVPQAASAFGGFGSTSQAPTNSFGGGATASGPAFGQPAALGGSGGPAFGQSSSLGGSGIGFGQTSALGSGSAFGQPSSLGANAPAFGRPSGFGAAATGGGAPAFGATSGFGAAAATTGFGAFGSSNQQQQQSGGGFGAFAGQSPQRVGFSAFASGSGGQVSFGSPVAHNQQSQQQQPSQTASTPSRTGLFGFSGYRG